MDSHFRGTSGFMAEAKLAKKSLLPQKQPQLVAGNSKDYEVL